MPATPSGRPSGAAVAATLRTTVVLSALACLFACRAPSTAGDPLRSVEALSRLPEREMAEGRRVELRGVITLFDPDWRLLVIQDGSAGVLVELPEHPPRLSLGQTIEVKGATSVDNHVPSVVTASLREIGTGSLPRPQSVAAKAVACGDVLYRRVEVEFRPVEGALGDGVHTARFEVPQPCGRLVVLGRLFRKYSPGRLVGRRLRVRGVPLPVYLPSGTIDHVRLMFEDDADADVLDGVPADGSLEETGASSGLPEIRSIVAVKALPRAEAMRGYPVRIEGAVTALNSRHDGYFLEDDSAAACIFLTPGHGDSPRPGQRVRVSGRTEAGGFAPVVRQLSIDVLGPARWPTPKKIAPGDTFHGWEENRWVELEGVAASVVAEGAANHLELFAGPRRLSVWFSEGDAPERLLQLVNARVSVQGVYSPLYTARARLLGFRLFTTSPDGIKILTPPPAASELRTIASVSGFDVRGTPRHRIRVAGVVTYKDSRGRVFLQDGDDALRVVGSESGDPPLHARATVEGFMSPDSRTPQLEHIRWVSVTPGSAIAPARTLAESLVSGDVDGRLVSVDGFLEGRRTSSGELQLNLQAGRSRFTAFLEAPGSDRQFPELRPGALLRLAGVGTADQDESVGGARSAEIWMRTPQDIVVVRPAPWWDLRRALYAASAAFLLLFGALVWVVRLRHNLVGQMAVRSKLEKQLLDTQKLESLGRLAGGVAHDFNNYLTVILGYTSLLQDALPGGHEVRAYLDTIRDVGDKAASMTRQLLAFSRKQVLQPVPCDPNEVIARARATLFPLIGEHIQLVIRPGKVGRVCIDPAQFLQVLINLAVNARDAMPNGGTLTFETGLEEFRAEEGARTDGPRAGRNVRISITDTGCGMDASTRQRIFEPFFTTKEHGRGTGLGLAVVFGIVKQSHGQIEVQSKPGEGTRFSIYLPVTQEPALTPVLPPSTADGRGDETILLVEDQEAVRTSIRLGLEAFGYHVLAAATPSEALTLLEDSSVSIDLLLTDVVMPGMSGPLLAAEAIVKRPDIRVLYMSGYPEAGLTEEHAVGGAMAYLQKPFTPQQGASAVRRTLDIHPS